jgi:hypothetical protein
MPLLTSACGIECSMYENAICGQAPVDPIEEFEVTITTGDEGTDRDVDLCLNWSDGDRRCITLDELLRDDFERWETDTYTENPGRLTEAGDLLFFEIHLEGGGVFDTSWEIVALTLVGILENGDTWLLYDEQQIECGKTIEAGESYRPMPCEY